MTISGMRFSITAHTVAASASADEPNTKFAVFCAADAATKIAVCHGVAHQASCRAPYALTVHSGHTETPLRFQQQVLRRHTPQCRAL